MIGAVSMTSLPRPGRLPTSSIAIRPASGRRTGRPRHSTRAPTLATPSSWVRRVRRGTPERLQHRVRRASSRSSPLRRDLPGSATRGASCAPLPHPRWSRRSVGNCTVRTTCITNIHGASRFAVSRGISPVAAPKPAPRMAPRTTTATNSCTSTSTANRPTGAAPSIANGRCGVSCAQRRGHGGLKRRWRATPSDSGSPPSSRRGP